MLKTSSNFTRPTREAQYCRVLRAETTVTLKWIANHLSMGSPGYLSDCPESRTTLNVSETLEGYMKLGATKVQDSGGVFCLDNEEVYRLFTINQSSKVVTHEDGPALGLNGSDSYGEIHFDFTTYVRFMPTTGPGPNIFATLGLVHWHQYESTSLEPLPSGGKDYTPIGLNNTLAPVYVLADPGDADCNRVITRANTMPWWLHTLTGSP
jgi:hypothetical protein